MEIESQLLLIKQKLIHQVGLDPEAEVAPIWDATRTHAGAILEDQPGFTYSLDQDSNLIVQRERAGRIEWAKVGERRGGSVAWTGSRVKAACPPG